MTRVPVKVGARLDEKSGTSKEAPGIFAIKASVALSFLERNGVAVGSSAKERASPALLSPFCRSRNRAAG